MRLPDLRIAVSSMATGPFAAQAQKFFNSSIRQDLQKALASSRGQIRALDVQSDAGGSVAAVEVTVPAAGRLEGPAHSHDHYEETIYGLEGVLTWTVDGKAIDVGPGEALCIPRGAVHRFDNNGDRDVKALYVITPAAIGPQFFRESAEVINAAAGGPPDRAKMLEIMRRHGLTPAPPPTHA